MTGKPRSRRQPSKPRAEATTSQVLAFSPDPRSLLPQVGAGSRGAPSQRFRVQRGRDLVNLHVSAFDCELVRLEGQALLRPAGPQARLEVRLPFQHVGEESFKVEPVSTSRTAQSRAAYGSRLVFRVPEGERLEYSVEGVLAALSRLPLIVVPAAQPKPPAPPGGKRTVVAVLPGDVGLFREADGLVLRDLTRTEAKSHAAAAGHTGDLRAAAVELSRARQMLALESATDRTRSGYPSLDDLVVPYRPVRPRRSSPRAPRTDETALEAPYRLILSPSDRGGFAHARRPVEAPTGRVELWHSRLGVRVERTAAPDGPPVVEVDETNAGQRVVRAVWARDLDGGAAPEDHEDDPFSMSLDGRDRAVLVTQTSDPTSLTPIDPVDAHKLYVSALGAYLDLSGAWRRSAAGVNPEILSWDHIAPMGRDQFVKVVYPGYLFPFGHSAALVKQTTRQVDHLQGRAVARLHTEFFLVVTQPVASYDARDMPFREVRVRPSVTPGLLDPNGPGNSVKKPSSSEEYKQLLFWPMLPDRQRLPFVLECLDHDGRRSRLASPLLFVGQKIDPSSQSPQGAKKTPPKVTFPKRKDVKDAWDEAGAIPAQQQSVAFATGSTPGQTALQAVSLTFAGEPAPVPHLTSTPRMTSADVVIPALQQVAPPGAPTAAVVTYPSRYLTEGFGGANTVLEQFLEISSPLLVDFTGASGSGGGFLAPNLPAQALTRLQGVVGDPGGYTSSGLVPETAFSALLPRLFGIFDLTELLGTDLPMPAFVSAALDDVSALIGDATALVAAVKSAQDRLQADATAAATQGLRDAAQAAHTAVAGLLTPLQDAWAEFESALDAAKGGALDPEMLELVTTLKTAVEKIPAALQTVTLPAAARAAIERPVRELLPLLEDAGALVGKVTSLLSGVQELAKSGPDRRASYSWTTNLVNYPKGRPNKTAVFVAEQGDDLCVLSMNVTAGPSGADVTAELTDFALNLFGEASLLRLEFDRLAFHAAAGQKPDVDVVFQGLEFLGVLGFVNTLKELVPFDGFSDPPYLDIDPSGLQAGFDLALPAVSVGVFSLENISLHAGVDIPFLGQALTAGFSFCTREKPFRLTVMMIGGGGFVGIELSPKGLVVLEMALEAGACLSINLGVASGSVSVMVGVYLRLEGEKGSLSGYFRIRGEMDVLGLISASITLELALTYHFASGKLIGRASVVVEVDVLLVSFSVSVSCERKLAGSNGDPTYADVLSIDASTGTAPEWDTYCAAFAAV